MKKITFVQRDDQTSYDPVSTFFTKKKTPSLQKPSNAKQIVPPKKTPIQKNIIQIQQQKTFIEQSNENIAQKIGQKGGSGYIPKKIPDNYQNSYQKLKQETVYNLKQKQKESTQTTKAANKYNSNRKPQDVKQNTLVQKKPDMVFDVPKRSNDQQDNNEVFIGKKQCQLDNVRYQDKRTLQMNEDGNKLPQIKSPPSNNSNRISSVANKTTQKIEKNPVSANLNNNKLSSSKEIRTNNFPSGATNTKTPPPKQNNPSMTNNKSAKMIDQQLKQKSELKERSLSLQQRVHQLQEELKYYLNKVQDLQRRIQLLVKTQQKYNKILKQHKQCAQRNSSFNQLSEQLTQAKESIRKFLSQQNVPYSKKRQYLLLNQIEQLKKTNRQLVLRIKSYKGTDLVEMAINKNKQEIAREFQIDYHQEYNKLNSQMQSNLASLISIIYDYLQAKSDKSKKPLGQEMNFENQQRFLLDINSMAEKISLIYLQKYQISPLPRSNEESINLYAEIQKEKQKILNSINQKGCQLIDKQQLNFSITENNLQIINDIQQNYSEMQSLQQKIHQATTSSSKQKQKRPGTSQGPTIKNIPKQMSKRISLMVQVFKKRSDLSTLFHIQSICYFTFLKEVIDEKLSKLQSQVVNLYGRLKQMKDIFDLGGSTAKQSLYLYLQTNLANFCLIVPNLQIKIKQLKSTYQQISKKLQKKLNTSQS